MSKLVKKTISRIGPILSSYSSGSLIGTQTLSGGFESIQTMGHDIHLLGKLDVGGPMLLERDMFEYVVPRVTGGTRNGTEWVITLSSPMSHPATRADSVLNPLGATAISRSNPINPSFSSVAVMREFRSDGIPSLPVLNAWKDKTKSLINKPGDEFLNVEFGWLPLVSDIRNFARTVRDHTKLLQDLREGSGKNTRVGYHFPEVKNESTTTGNILIYTAGNSGVTHSSPGRHFMTQTKKTWFSGCFTYHLPVSDNQMGKAMKYMAYADKLLGVKPTPGQIWQSSPWTWALDWFANTGDVMDNISHMGQDGLVMKYGYLMDYVSTKDIWFVDANVSGTASYSQGSTTRIRENKKRIPASPYGFGVSDADLSSVQKAVIAALGLQFVGKALH
jgi:hypothetical protein